MSDSHVNTHSMFVGYLTWIFGFTGSHRFYFGKPISGMVYFFTLGLLGIGWLIDLFLIPGMDRAADHRFRQGPYDYTLGWLLLTFTGVLGLHRLYMGKWFTAVVYFFTFGFFLIGYVYDLWTLNSQISELNGERT